MVYALQADLVFSSVSRRDQVYADLQTQINGSTRWGETVLVAFTTPPMHLLGAGLPAIRVETRFTTRAALDSITARIEAFATGQRRPITGSWYDVHECPHDGNAVTCSATRRVW